MLKKTLKISIVLFLIGNGSFAQWSGSTTTSGDAYRDGNVGIGTTSPNDKLQVAGNLRLANGGADGPRLVWRGGINGTQEYRARVAGDGYLAFFPGEGAPHSFALTQNGNIGIGMTNPSAKLEIADGDNATLRVGITSNKANFNSQFLTSLAVVAKGNNAISHCGAVASDFYNDGNNPSWSGTLLEHYGTTVQTGEYGVDTRNMGLVKFQNVAVGVLGSNGANIHVSPGGNLAATFLTNGNVGIGTANPGNFKLAVEGKIAARGVKVTTTAFADYVFEPTYKLRPLSSVENYINENKHLPGMPSAKEVEKEGGFELGNMNVKLLEKIEELTLYVIELKKENEQMKKEIKEIKEKK